MHAASFSRSFFSYALMIWREFEPRILWLKLSLFISPFLVVNFLRSYLRKECRYSISGQIIVRPFGNNASLSRMFYMLFAGLEVHMVKNCDRGLEKCCPRTLRPMAAFSRPRTQFFTIRTDP